VGKLGVGVVGLLGWVWVSDNLRVGVEEGRRREKREKKKEEEGGEASLFILQMGI